MRAARKRYRFKLTPVTVAPTIPNILLNAVLTRTCPAPATLGLLGRFRT
jgi:hypothetical protein